MTENFQVLPRPEPRRAAHAQGSVKVLGGRNPQAPEGPSVSSPSADGFQPAGNEAEGIASTPTESVWQLGYQVA
jgi:hypothetical protein